MVDIWQDNDEAMSHLKAGLNLGTKDERTLMATSNSKQSRHRPEASVRVVCVYLFTRHSTSPTWVQVRFGASPRLRPRAREPFGEGACSKVRKRGRAKLRP